MTTITLDTSIPEWNIRFLAPSEELSPTEKILKEATETLSSTFSAASKDIQVSVHPLKNNETYDKVYSVYQKIKGITGNTNAETLKRCVLSLKLGGEITPEILAQHPDFVKFIQANHWHNKSIHYEQILPLVDGEPGIFFEGKAVKFSDFCNTDYIDQETKELKGACIIKQGIIAKDQHYAKEVFAHTHEDPSTWGNQYIYEVVTSLNQGEDEDKTRFSGNHCWLRLRDKNGDVYSWGVLRPKISNWEYAKQRSRQMLNGQPVCPDPFETMEKKDHNLLATQIPITEEQFKEVLGNLNRMCKDGVPYGVLSGLTCQGHVVHQAAKCGIKIQATMTTATYLGKCLFGSRVKQIWRGVMPKFIRIALTYIADFFLQFFWRLAGVHEQDPKIREVYGDEYNGYAHGFFNFIKPVEIYHPVAMRAWQRKVEAYRNSEEGRAKGPYALP